MTKRQYAIWIFPIVLNVIIFLFVFSLSLGRPVTGIFIGLIVGSCVALLTKLINDEFQIIDYSENCQVKWNDIPEITRLFINIWLSPLKKFISNYLMYLMIFAGIALVLFLIINGIINGL